MSIDQILNDRICRACLHEAGQFHLLLEVTDQQICILKMLDTTTPQLHIRLGADALPEAICSGCLNKLKIAYNFQKMCIASDKKLKENLIQQKPESTDIAHVDSNIGPSPVGLMSASEGHPDAQTQIIDPLQEQPVDINLHIDDEAIEEENQLNNDDNEFDFGTDLDIVKQECLSTEESQPDEIIPSDSDCDPVNIEKPKILNPQNMRHTCKICQKVFDRLYNLQRHMGVHSEAYKFKCDICNYGFATKSFLSGHKKRSHSTTERKQKSKTNVIHKCTECSRQFEKRESLMAHSQTHRRVAYNRNIWCEWCPETFAKISLLAEHAESKHADVRKYACSLCPKVFPLNVLYIEHRQTHKGLKPFVCYHCNKSFQLNRLLEEHLRTHTKESPFLCAECGKSFKNPSNLRQHLLRHGMERRYECKDCPSKFNCRSDLTKHKSVHRKIKPHVCDICGSSYTRSYSLTKHKFTHKGERPHKCEECNMTFIFIDHLRRHMRTHTGEKPYACKYCDRAYAESGDLTKHLRTHVGTNTYMCPECPAAFKYKAELREHVIGHFKEKQAVPADPNIENPSQ